MSDETKPLDLAAIKARCAAATPGPWTPKTGKVWHVEIFEHPTKGGLVATITTDCGRSTVGRMNANAEFIAHARTDVPALVAEVERLRSDLASCYRITGADPDGDDDAMLARKAVNAVRRLREESDHQGARADEFAEEVKTMAGERDAARAAIELVKTDRRFAQENADWYRVRLGMVTRENDALAETVKKLRDDIAEAAGVNAANLNTLRSVRERVAELEEGLGSAYHGLEDSEDRAKLRALLAKGGA